MKCVAQRLLHSYSSGATTLTHPIHCGSFFLPVLKVQLALRLIRTILAILLHNLRFKDGRLAERDFDELRERLTINLLPGLRQLPESGVQHLAQRTTELLE